MIVEDFREYLADLLREGYSVRHDEHGSDPDLIDPGGNPVETWREDYPYDERMERDQYEDEKYAAADRAVEVPVLGAGHRRQARDLVRGPGRGGQGRHDQALHGAPQPASRHGSWR